MSIFSKLFGKKNAEEAEGTVRVGGMEDFMTLIRVYYQAVMAAQLGISNINFLPDMAVFKRTLKIPTQNNKLGIAEKSRIQTYPEDSDTEQQTGYRREITLQEDGNGNLWHQ